MSSDDTASASELHPFLVAASALNDTFEGLRRDIIIPFAAPEDSHVHFDVWHQHELTSRDECESVIEHWFERPALPEASDNALFFLRHRFDQFALFLESLVLADGTTVLEHPTLDLHDFVFWGLIEWWESHGIREAYFEDLSFYEHQQDSSRKV